MRYDKFSRFEKKDEGSYEILEKAFKDYVLSEINYSGSMKIIDCRIGPELYSREDSGYHACIKLINNKGSDYPYVTMVKLDLTASCEFDVSKPPHKQIKFIRKECTKLKKSDIKYMFPKRRSLKYYNTLKLS